MKLIEFICIEVPESLAESLEGELRRFGVKAEHVFHRGGRESKKRYVFGSENLKLVSEIFVGLSNKLSAEKAIKSLSAAMGKVESAIAFCTSPAALELCAEARGKLRLCLREEHESLEALKARQ